ncbi:hypothetical protein HMPREF1982_02426 [Clostridiales bacterium oral taxon 876 str. F0540]|nr:hypothetical protein HMPREF1982_02426 [Clostridiales bacterium oral taxon 876 str. F0540]
MYDLFIIRKPFDILSSISMQGGERLKMKKYYYSRFRYRSD